MPPLSKLLRDAADAGMGYGASLLNGQFSTGADNNSRGNPTSPSSLARANTKPPSAKKGPSHYRQHEPAPLTAREERERPRNEAKTEEALDMELDEIQYAIKMVRRREDEMLEARERKK